MIANIFLLLVAHACVRVCVVSRGEGWSGLEDRDLEKGLTPSPPWQDPSHEYHGPKDPVGLGGSGQGLPRLLAWCLATSILAKSSSNLFLGKVPIPSIQTCFAWRVNSSPDPNYLSSVSFRQGDWGRCLAGDKSTSHLLKGGRWESELLRVDFEPEKSSHPWKLGGRNWKESSTDMSASLHGEWRGSFWLLGQPTYVSFDSKWNQKILQNSGSQPGVRQKFLNIGWWKM